MIHAIIICGLIFVDIQRDTENTLVLECPVSSDISTNTVYSELTEIDFPPNENDQIDARPKRCNAPERKAQFDFG